MLYQSSCQRDTNLKQPQYLNCTQGRTVVETADVTNIILRKDYNVKGDDDDDDPDVVASAK